MKQRIASRFGAPSDSQFLQRIKLGEAVRICSVNIIISGMRVGMCSKVRLVWGDL